MKRMNSPRRGEAAVRALLLVSLTGWAMAAQAAPSLSAGCSADFVAKAAGKYSNLSNGSPGAREINLGLPTLVGASTGDLTWAGGKAIQFSYDGASQLTTRVGTGTSQVTVTHNIGALGDLNALELTIFRNGTGTAIAFNSILVGASPVGSISSAGDTCWTVSGATLGAGFTVTGTLALTGTFPGNGANLTIRAGYLPPADEEGPATSDVQVSPDPVLLNGNASVTALVDDSNAGGSAVASAEYSLNGGGWTAMAAIDGAFDSLTEGVEATFAATQIGSNLVCVRGTDALGNVGDATCQTFLVAYRFEGFFSPIDNDLLNSAKAGQAIPAKWRLTDANGVPIASAASFAGLYSSQNLCDGNLPTDAVEEEAAGSSGLQYIGDGYWQFNWKTPKDYAGTCRAMYVVFDSEQTSPVVKFQFKR